MLRLRDSSSYVCALGWGDLFLISIRMVALDKVPPNVCMCVCVYLKDASKTEHD